MHTGFLLTHCALCGGAQSRRLPARCPSDWCALLEAQLLLTAWLSSIMEGVEERDYRRKVWGHVVRWL